MRRWTKLSIKICKLIRNCNFFLKTSMISQPDVLLPIYDLVILRLYVIIGLKTTSLCVQKFRKNVFRYRVRYTYIGFND